MGKGGKKGPPYLNNPGATFIVIEHPWGQNGDRNSQDVIDNIGSWVRFMSRQQGRLEPAQDKRVEVIYTRRTTDTVIVKLPEDVDLAHYLGAHKWTEFLIPDARPGHELTYSNIFEYNYRNNGEPSNHNWDEHWPTFDLPTPEFPIIFPYPPPSYAQRPASLISLTKAMPEPIQYPPTPPPVVALEEKQPLDHSADDKAIIKALINKKDPFEEEDTATQFLQSAHVKTEPEESKPVIVKQEVSNEYQPSSDYFALATQHHVARGKDQQHLEVKSEALDQKPVLKTYKPKGELVDAIQHLQAQRQMAHGTTADLVKGEQSATFDSTHFTRDPRKRPLDRSRPPPAEEQDDSRYLKKIKMESK